MKRALSLLAAVAALLVLVVLVMILLTPWMDRWGSTEAEIQAIFPGDELLSNPKSFVNRAITINAEPKEIFPWLVQLGAEKGGFYSFTVLERMMNCPQTNADRIFPEWQNLKVGDQVKMCPGDAPPPPYIVAQILPNQALVLGHQENGEWVDLWQFVLVPQSEGVTRLILRTRTMMTGGFWDIIHPGVFLMEYGLLHGVKERAEATDLAKVFFYTPTPEIFIPVNRTPAPPDSDLPLTCQITDLNVLINREGGYCFAYPLRFGEEPAGTDPASASVAGPEVGSAVEAVQARFIVEVSPFDPAKTLDEQADEFLRSFTVVELSSLVREPVRVEQVQGLLVEPVPVQLSWRIIFVEHSSSLFRLMYWPVDVAEAQADLEELYQTTLNSFAFIEPK